MIIFFLFFFFLNHFPVVFIKQVVVYRRHWISSTSNEVFKTLLTTATIKSVFLYLLCKVELSHTLIYYPTPSAVLYIDFSHSDTVLLVYKITCSALAMTCENITYFIRILASGRQIKGYENFGCSRISSEPRYVFIPWIIDSQCSVLKDAHRLESWAMKIR